MSVVGFAQHKRSEAIRRSGSGAPLGATVNSQGWRLGETKPLDLCINTPQAPTGRPIIRDVIGAAPCNQMPIAYVHPWHCFSNESRFVMPELLITCPNTNKPIETGIAMQKGPIADDAFQDNSLQCPHCGDVHSWSSKDVYFAGDPPKPLK